MIAIKFEGYLSGNTLGLSVADAQLMLDEYIRSQGRAGNCITGKITNVDEMPEIPSSDNNSNSQSIISDGNNKEAAS
jgi:hypothetical protein